MIIYFPEVLMLQAMYDCLMEGRAVCWVADLSGFPKYEIKPL